MKNHETHLPTQQTPSQENNWIPRSHGDCGRPQSDQPTPQSGSQKTCRLTFPKTIRLRSRWDFQRVNKVKKRLVGRFFCVDYRLASKLRLGLSVSGRYGSAPERNRFKRLVREAFRTNYTSLPPLELNIIPRQCAKGASCEDVTVELIRLLHEAK